VPTGPAAAESLRAEGPPVLEGDTARVDTAAVARPDSVEALQLAPSGLAIPVAGVRPEGLVNTFDEARGEGRHDALDILAPRGTPVLAAADGVVLRLFTSERGGLTIYQLGPDERTVYYYAHLDGYAEGLADGQRLARGEVIGYVGDTGNAAPGNTHLHFAMWRISDPADFWEGAPINPYPLLGGR
jgi:murein DD-endopeptidase MepM/ murein hydrolase activator NlpD